MLARAGGCGACSGAAAAAAARRLPACRCGAAAHWCVLATFYRVLRSLYIGVSIHYRSSQKDMRHARCDGCHMPCFDERSRSDCLAGCVQHWRAQEPVAPTCPDLKGLLGSGGAEGAQLSAPPPPGSGPGPNPDPGTSAARRTSGVRARYVDVMNAGSSGRAPTARACNTSLETS